MAARKKTATKTTTGKKAARTHKGQLPGAETQATHEDELLHRQTLPKPNEDINPKKPAPEESPRPVVGVDLDPRSLPLAAGQLPRGANQIPAVCFAPPLTDAKLAEYRTLADGLGADRAEVKDAMLQCLTAVEQWWALPDSTRKDGPRFRARVPQGGGTHREVTYQLTPLEPGQVEQLWANVPWMRELQTMSNAQGTGVFDGLPNGPLRNAAFHLLWHATELTLDREPVTQDKLKNA